MPEPHLNGRPEPATVPFTPPAITPAKRKRADPSDPRPTKGMIAKLLRLLRNGSYHYTTQDIEDAEKAVEAKRNELLKDKEYVRLKSRAEKLRSQHSAASNGYRTKFREIERRFLAEGATPAVLAAVNALRKEYEKAKATRLELRLHDDYP